MKSWTNNNRNVVTILKKIDLKTIRKNYFVLRYVFDE